MYAIIGNPGVGKTTLLKKLAQNGYKTLNVDSWALRQYNNPKTIIYQKLVKIFGKKIVLNNKIGKTKLKQLIIKDQQNLTKIEMVVHQQLKKVLQTKQFDFVEIPIIKFSPINFVSLFEKIINIYHQQKQNNSNHVDNFKKLLISNNKRQIRQLLVVNINAKNLTKIELFLKKVWNTKPQYL